MTSKNKKTLESFIAYCAKHKDERFWQALKNWAGVNAIFTVTTFLWPSIDKEKLPNFLHDTFYD